MTCAKLAHFTQFTNFLRIFLVLKNVNFKTMNTQLTDKERINAIFDYVINTYSRITNQREFSDFTGINSRSMNGALTGRLKVAKTIWQSILDKFPEFSEEWVMFGRGQMLKPDKQDRTQIPIISHLKDKLNEYVVIPDFARLGCDFMVRVSGDSMVPYANNSDLVACRMLDSATFFQFGKVYVIGTSQGLLVKVVQQAHDSNSIALHSYNPAYADFTIPKSEIKEVAMVLGIVKME